MIERNEITNGELEFLGKIRNGKIKLCEGNDCHFHQEHHKKKWSPAHFKISLSRIVVSPEFWVWFISTILMALTFFLLKPTEKIVVASLISNAALGGLFVLFKPISGLIERGNLSIEAKIGATVQRILTERKAVNDKRRMDICNFYFGYYLP